VLHNTDDSWMKEGACRTLNIGPTIFFLEMGKQSKVANTAKRVCSRCPVREECREYAIDNHIDHGIWGGMTERERTLLRRRRILLDRSRSA
jgi:WhiB family redox-sensing transcriptional regulator